MKKKTFMQTFALITVIAICFSCAIVSAEGEGDWNLLTDGEFNSPIGTYADCVNFPYSEDPSCISTPGAGGVANGSMLQITGGSKNGVQFTYNIENDVSAGKTSYGITFWYKVSRTDLADLLYVKLTETGSSYKEQSLITTPVAAGKWIKYETTYNINNTSNTLLTLMLRNAATESNATDIVCFDRVSLYYAGTKPIPPEEVNLIEATSNYGFEGGNWLLRASNATNANPTENTGATYYVWNNATEAHTGSRYLQVSNGTVGGVTTGCFYPSAGINTITGGESGTSYRLSFWAKTNDIDVEDLIYIKICSNKSAGNEWAEHHYFTPKKAGVWEKFTIHFTMPAAADVGLQCGIRIPSIVTDGGKSFCVDDIIVTKTPTKTVLGIGDLYDEYLPALFKNGETVKTCAWFVPTAETPSGVIVSVLYELNGNAKSISNIDVKSATSGYYETDFVIPTTGTYFVKNILWKDYSSVTPICAWAELGQEEPA